MRFIAELGVRVKAVNLQSLGAPLNLILEIPVVKVAVIHIVVLSSILI